ncbi:TonB-dependent receptor [Qipengyuania aurantiaca]|nr:TonB-dependent receptor [Qipengyuania aurantiaca]
MTRQDGTFRAALCLSAAGLAAAVPAHAQEVGPPEPQSESEPIVITGTRMEAVLADEPYTVSVIDFEALERDLPRTVPEALDEIPGVMVQKTAAGHGSPYIRGFTGNRTLLVIDGIRYNNATYRDGANEYFAQVDPFTLERIELVAGPASALYGSEAVGGTLALSTRAPALFGKEGAYVGGEQVLRASSGDASLVSRTAIDLGEGGKWGFRGGVTARDYGDIRAADFGRQPYTGYREAAADGRLDVVLSPGWTATFAHQTLWQDDVPRTHSTLFAVPFERTVAGDDRSREKDHIRSLTYAKLNGEPGRAWLDDLEVTLSRQTRRESELRVRGDGRRVLQSFDSDLTALSAVAVAPPGTASVMYGFDLSHEGVDSARTDTDPLRGIVRRRLQGPVGDDASYAQAGVFGRVDLLLGERLKLEAGLRFSRVAARIGTFADPVTGEARSFKGDWSDLSGTLRAQYRVGAHRLWAGYGRAFRAPNIADLSRFGASRSTEIEVASPDLGPERFDTFELAWRYEGDALELGASAYTTALIDYIETVPTGRMREGLVEVAKQNAASGRVNGVELTARARLTSALSLQGNATWLEGHLTSPTTGGEVREPISRIQPLTANLALKWERDTHWLRADLRLAGRADELSSGDLLDRERIPPAGTPGYALLGLAAGIQLAERIEATLALENLLDEAYRVHGSGTNEPGRHVRAGLRFSF